MKDATSVAVNARLEANAPHGWCPRCGEPAKLVGSTAANLWLYCACGNAWTEPR